MANPSEPVSCAKYGVEPVCHGCGRRLRANRNDGEPLWLVGYPRRAVYGVCCWKEGAKP